MSFYIKWKWRGKRTKGSTIANNCSAECNETPQPNQELYRQIQKQGTFAMTRSGWISENLTGCLLLGHCAINQDEMYTLFHTYYIITLLHAKTMLLLGHYYNQHTNIFTSAHHSTCHAEI